MTNTQYIKQVIEEGLANSVLIKLNQIGMVSETIAAVRLSREAEWRYFISYRSGDTKDTFLAGFDNSNGRGGS